jgi:hypothetical protein
MKQISAGDGMLWAISEENCIYFRDNITKAYPGKATLSLILLNGDLRALLFIREGTKWIKISDKVKYVSCNASNQVYCIDKLGSLLYRHGITAQNPKGNSWEPVLSVKAYFYTLTFKSFP